MVRWFAGASCLSFQVSSVPGEAPSSVAGNNHSERRRSREPHTEIAQRQAVSGGRRRSFPGEWCRSGGRPTVSGGLSRIDQAAAVEEAEDFDDDDDDQVASNDED